jgi:aliphatic nitrilase
MSQTNNIIRVAAVQYSPDLETKAGTVDRVLQAVAEAAGQGAQLVVFPETFIPYYPYFSIVLPPAMIAAEQMRLYDNAVAVPGPVTDALAAAAIQHQTVIAVGVTERDHDSLYNTQLVFDVDGTMIMKHRKIMPAFHERMIWGMGDGTSLKVVDSAVGRLGALTCWEHYSPLARYALMAQHEQIHISTYIGSAFGPVFTAQTEVQIRNHALESGCFVVNATAWLSDEQINSVTDDPKMRDVLRGGCMTAIIGPDGMHVVPPLTDGAGILVADLDMSMIVNRKRMMDIVGHFARPDLLSLGVHSRETPLIRNDEPAQAKVRADDAKPAAADA